MGQIITERVVTFLLDKGFTRVDGEPFSFCNFGDGSVVVTLDEEYATVDVDQIAEDWDSQGAGDLAAELVEYITHLGEE